MLRKDKIIKTTVIAQWLVTSCLALLPGDVASSHEMIIQIDGNDLHILRLSDFCIFSVLYFSEPEFLSPKNSKPDIGEKALDSAN